MTFDASYRDCWIKHLSEHSYSPRLEIYFKITRKVKIYPHFSLLKETILFLTSVVCFVFGFVFQFDTKNVDRYAQNMHNNPFWRKCSDFYELLPWDKLNNHNTVYSQPHSLFVSRNKTFPCWMLSSRISNKIYGEWNHRKTK